MRDYEININKTVSVKQFFSAIPGYATKRKHHFANDVLLINRVALECITKVMRSRTAPASENTTLCFRGAE